MLLVSENTKLLFPAGSPTTDRTEPLSVIEPAGLIRSSRPSNTGRYQRFACGATNRGRLEVGSNQRVGSQALRMRTLLRAKRNLPRSSPRARECHGRKWNSEAVARFMGRREGAARLAKPSHAMDDPEPESSFEARDLANGVPGLRGGHRAEAAAAVGKSGPKGWGGRDLTELNAEIASGC